MAVAVVSHCGIFSQDIKPIRWTCMIFDEVHKLKGAVFIFILFFTHSLLIATRSQVTAHHDRHGNNYKTAIWIDGHSHAK